MTMSHQKGIKFQLRIHFRTSRHARVGLYYFPQISRFLYTVMMAAPSMVIK